MFDVFLFGFSVVLPDLKETDPDLVTEMVIVLVQEGLLGNSEVKRVELQLITNLLSTGYVILLCYA